MTAAPWVLGTLRAMMEPQCLEPSATPQDWESWPGAWPWNHSSMDRLPREENMQEILKKKTELKNDFSIQQGLAETRPSKAVILKPEGKTPRRAE